MKVLVTGAGGQLARALAAQAPAHCTVSALTRAELDIADARAVAAAVDALRPEIIVNAAAYTAVDRAESEPDRAFRVNRDGTARLAEAAARIGARFVHFSTDYVFDGRSGLAYRPEDSAAPLNVYGTSKLAGEEAVRASGARALIVRSAWLYSTHGANFLTTMLRMLNARREVRVVADQVGTPTSTLSLAGAAWGLVEANASGLVHFTDAGIASWYDFAEAIAAEGSTLNRVPRGVRVVPIATADYPTAGRRPAFSALDSSTAWGVLGAPAPYWRTSLRLVLESL